MPPNGFISVRGHQRVKKASQSLPRLRQIKSNLFCGGAHPRVASLVPLGQFTFCTRRKIQYRTQVCSLSASSGQRASPKGISVGHAQCPARDFVEKPNRFFDRLMPPNGFIPVRGHLTLMGRPADRYALLRERAKKTPAAFAAGAKIASKDFDQMRIAVE